MPPLQTNIHVIPDGGTDASLFYMAAFNTFQIVSSLLWSGMWRDMV